MSDPTLEGVNTVYGDFHSFPFTDLDFLLVSHTPILCVQ